MELTNNLKKTIASLDEAKHRKSLGLFKVEGTKSVMDTIGKFRLEYLIATDEWLGKNQTYGNLAIKASARDLDRMSSLVTSPGVMAVYRIPDHDNPGAVDSDSLVIALDSIRDPGNLGTIIRIADWFGIDDIYCSHDTTDCYSPKVVQATMGSIARVKIHYVDIVSFLKSNDHVPVFGTFLDGGNIYKSNLTENGIIVIGNESHGISDAVSDLVTHRLTIPSYPPGRPTGESLNAAVATAVTVAAFRQRQWLNK